MDPPPIQTSPASRRQQSGFALASMVLGICGIVLCLGPLAGIPAVIFGHRAQSEIKKSGGTLTGTGLATTGLVTGYISILMIFFLGLLAAIAIPNLVRARRAAQDQACQQNLMAIQGAKAIWARHTESLTDAIPKHEDLFGPAKYISEKPDCPAGGTYLLNAVGESPACTIHGTPAAQ